MNGVKAVALVWLPCLLLAQVESPRANLREFLGLGPVPDATAANLGEALYKQNCGACHGPAARGAQGPNLVRSPLVLHDEKGEEISQVITQGRPQSGMPAFPDLGATQCYQISEYIHQQVELAANRGSYRETYSDLRSRLTGQPGLGKEFFAANCSNCHSTSGDLAHIGTAYPQPSALLIRIAWPSSNAPRPAVITLPAGEKVSGHLIKLDDFDVSLRDSSGAYRSWSRSEVKVDVLDKLAGHRDLLPRYSDADLHNLIAYLASLK